MHTMGLLDFFTSLFYEWQTFPLVIQIAVAVIFLSLIVMGAMMLNLYILRRRHRRDQRVEAKIKPEIKTFFLKLMESDDAISTNKIYDGFHEIAGKVNTESRQWAVDVLIRIKERKLDSSVVYKDIISALELEAFLEKKFEFSSDATKTKAIRELQLLGLRQLDSKVLPFAYSKNKDMKREARLSHLKLSESDPYRFLDETDYDLTPWDEISLLKILEEQYEKDQLENLGQWIAYSKNETLVVFLIRAAGIFNLVDTKSILIKKLKSDSVEIRSTAIRSLGKINAVDVEKRLIQMYRHEPEMVQQSIIEAIGEFKTGKQVAFLQRAFSDASTVELKKKITETIYHYPKSIGQDSLFEKMKEDKSGLEKKIFEHVETDLVASK